MKKRWTATIEPFDATRVLNGEALVRVELPDGRYAIAKIASTDEMYLIGKELEVSPTREATTARQRHRSRAELMVGQMTEAGFGDIEIAAKMVSEGYLTAADVTDQLRIVKRWRKGYRRVFGPIA
ncbi:MAG: hypothetical protein V4515_01795 [Chloroflexota bacterium]